MKDYKIGLFVFLILATIISLFPPFEWGDENIKTEKERTRNRNILESLPIKKYDFLFATNKKYFPIGSYQRNEKVYEGDKIKTDTSDIITKEISVGADTFFLNKYMKDGRYLQSFLNTPPDVFEYNEIKNRTGNTDTIQHYKIYKIAKPHWFLLQRKLILNELVLQYLLAGFIGFFVQIIITFAKRKALNEKST